MVLDAAFFGILGEAVHRALTRAGLRSPRWGLEERVVVDLSLGAGLLFALLWIPLPIFGIPLLLGLLVASVLALGLTGFPREFRRWAAQGPERVRAALSPPNLIVLASFLLVLGLEVWVASQSPTGNTLDEANAALSTSSLLAMGHFGSTLAPFSSYPALAPRGMVVWFAVPVQLLGLPAYSAPFSVTPLFLALSTLAAASVGRRWVGDAWGGAAFAATLALLASWPRLLAVGSDDFAFALPLALLLLPALGSVLDPRGSPRAAPAWPWIALLAGLDLTYSPVPLEVLGLGVVLGAVGLALSFPSKIRELLRRSSHLGLAGILSLLAALPTLLLFATGSVRASPVAGEPHALGWSRFLTYTDPFLFGPSQTWVSPFPILLAELLTLLMVGCLLLLFGLPARLGPWTGLSVARRDVGLGVSGAVGLLLLMLPGGSNPLYWVGNASETSILLLVFEAMIAALPVGLGAKYLFGGEGADRRGRTPLAPRSLPAPARPAPRLPPPVANRWVPLVVLLVGVLAVVPPVVETATAVPTYLAGQTAPLGNVTPDDLAALRALGGLPVGPVLVAPGSAGEFAPAFSRDPVVYPLVGIGGELGYAPLMTHGHLSLPFSGPASNATYQALVAELTYGNLTSSVPGQLEELGIRYVVVTGDSTTLFPPFLPAPLLDCPSVFPLLYPGAGGHAEGGDAYVFGVLPAAGTCGAG